MKIKTTKEIKKGNDYCNKIWIEATDIIIKLSSLLKELEIDVENKKEDKELIVFEEKDIKKELKKIEEFSQKFNNLSQSNRMIWNKIDRLFGKNTIEKEEIDKKIENIYSEFSQINDRLRILEGIILKEE